MTDTLRPLAVVTGASSGIGYELARQFAENGFDLVLAADGPDIVEAGQAMRAIGVQAEAVQADLSTPDGVEKLHEAVQSLARPVDVLAANAGIGLGKSFFDQDFGDIVKVIDTNVTGTLKLIHLIGREMRERGQGRILITGSIAGFLPGSFQAVYNGTKAFLDNFSFAIRNELKDSGVTVTCLMPGPTDTEFFARADMLDTKVGQDKKDDPADVAKVGFEALMRGDGDVVYGVKNKLQAGMAAVTPKTAVAEMHRGLAEPRPPSG